MVTMLAPRLSTMGHRIRMPKTTDKFYLSPAWRSLLRHLIKTRGATCERCARSNCRIFGDHIVELKDGGEAMEPTNVQLLCGSCHVKKTNEARRARAGSAAALG